MYVYLSFFKKLIRNNGLSAKEISQRTHCKLTTVEHWLDGTEPIPFWVAERVLTKKKNNLKHVITVDLSA